VGAELLVVNLYEAMYGVDRAVGDSLNGGIGFVSTEDGVFGNDLEDAVNLRFKGLLAEVCRGIQCLVTKVPGFKNVVPDDVDDSGIENHSISLVIAMVEGPTMVTLYNVKYIPGFMLKLFSLSCAMKKGANIQNEGMVLKVQKGKLTLIFKNYAEMQNGCILGLELVWMTGHTPNGYGSLQLEDDWTT